MVIRNIFWPHDREAVLDLIRQTQGEEDFILLTASYGESATFDPADCFVIEGDVDGELAAHAMLIPHQLQIGSSVLPTAEIGLFSVGTAYLGRGYEGLLLDALHMRMAEREDVLGLSFGDPMLLEAWQYEYAVGLYLTNYESGIDVDLALQAAEWDARHGYERRTAEQLGVRRYGASVRRFYLTDLPAVQALYYDESTRGHYIIARDENTWLAQLDSLTRVGHNDPDDFLVAEVNDRLVAYIRLVTQDPVNVFRGVQAAHFSIIEAGGIDPDGIDALLGTVAHMAQTLTVERIGLFVHPNSIFMRHALLRGATLRHFTGSALVRLHNLPLALYQLVPTLEDRRMNSRFAQRAYQLVITTEHEEADVYLGMGDAEVVEIEAPSTSIVRLFTGWYGIDHLALGYHERYIDLLRVLFPQRDPKIGLADVI